jgi:hypothetical protein
MLPLRFETTVGPFLPVPAVNGIEERGARSGTDQCLRASI